MRDDIDVVTSLPFAHKVVSEQEPLGSVDFYDPMADREAKSHSPVLPFFHDAPVFSVGDVVTQEFLGCQATAFKIY